MIFKGWVAEKAGAEDRHRAAIRKPGPVSRILYRMLKTELSIFIEVRIADFILAYETRSKKESDLAWGVGEPGRFGGGYHSLEQGRGQVGVTAKGPHFLSERPANWNQKKEAVEVLVRAREGRPSLTSSQS